MTLTNHGTPVVSSRQWTTALSPNAAGTDWNYIVNYGLGDHPMQWTVLKNFTTSPVEVQSETLANFYTNSNFQYSNQLRAANGRIFFLQVQGYITYYEPTTETINQLAQVIESPPTDPNASTQFYSASFDTSGMLWTATQESHYRRSMLAVVDPTTNPPTPTIVAYFGSGALSYSTFGFYVAPDTGTAKKFVYAVYGEDPWQLWKIDVTLGGTYGTATLMKFPDGTDAQVPSTGNISFQFIAGQGVACTTHTDLGHPDDVVKTWWLLDGVMYVKTNNISPSPRAVTPASAPLTSPPQIDTTGGAGILRWRANGSSGAYTNVDYTVNFASPIALESLTPSSDGVVGNAEQYGGVFQYHEPADTRSWWGPWSSGVSEPHWTTAGGLLYVSGYPNGALYSYDPTAAWNLGTNPPTTAINPKYLGSLGLTGTQFAGIKYSRAVASSTIGTGRVFVAGDRDRNGVGCGIGYWDKQTNTLAGVYSSADGSTGPAVMSGLLTAGLTVSDGAGLVALATNTITGTGTASIITWNRSLTSPVVYTPIASPRLGPVWMSSDANVMAGAYISAGLLYLYRFNIVTGTLVRSTFLEYGPTIDGYGLDTATSTMWLAVGNTAVGVNPDALTVKTVDITSINPVSNLAVYSGTLYMTSGATVWSAPVPSGNTVPYIDPNVIFPSGEIGRALGLFDFYDLIIQTINLMATQLGTQTIDVNVIRATASSGKAQDLVTFFGTIVTAINLCATALSQATLDVNIINPRSKTGQAFDHPEFYATIIATINSLIDHLQ